LYFAISLGSQIMSNRIPEKIYRPVNFVIIAGIILSILMMLQPFTIVLYRMSFSILVISLLGFIFWSHITPYQEPDEWDENPI
jgi:Na+-translocating ferredoxin:NAD+ oxidoreductase RnfE subunit